METGQYRSASLYYRYSYVHHYTLGIEKNLKSTNIIAKVGGFLSLVETKFLFIEMQYGKRRAFRIFFYRVTKIAFF